MVFDFHCLTHPPVATGGYLQVTPTAWLTDISFIAAANQTAELCIKSSLVKRLVVKVYLLFCE